jgi:uncharacterized FAD-dependent dehydrogenase
MPLRQKHIGSDKLPELIDKMMNHIISKGGEFLLSTGVRDVLIEDPGNKQKRRIRGIILEDGSEIHTDNVILAPGRIGNEWFNRLVDSHKIGVLYNPIDIGVRIETNYEVFKDLTDVNYDPKIYIYTKKYHDMVRTFCTNPRGFVAMEKYDTFIGVNGHAERDRKSNNTNFAFLNTVRLTEPLENTLNYGKSIAQLATTIGGGKVLLQTLGDLKIGRRSTYDRIRKSFVEPTLKDYAPGNISMALPHRIVSNILDGIEKLDAIAPGIDSDNTLIYAPEIKFQSIKAKHNDKLESVAISGLYFAGDGCGLTRDIINASSTGVFVARNIIGCTISDNCK